MKIDRRNALSLLALTGAAPFAITETKAAYTGHVIFEHGVASGDPLQDRAVLWTRVTPVEAGTLAIPVEWEVAKDRPSTQSSRTDARRPTPTAISR